MRYLVKVSYLGSNYQGWQRQESAPSIQGKIEAVLSKIYNKEIVIYGSGRTDAGVHAYGQYFHYDAEEKYKEKDIKHRLNCLLPDDIEIISVKKVDDNFHARFNVKQKTYFYLIQNTQKNSMLSDRVYLYKENIDYRVMKKASKLFVGKHCFKDFTSKDEDEDNFNREIYSLRLRKTGKNIILKIVGNGFMKYEIRFIVGALLAIGSKKENIDFIKYHLKDDKEREIITYKAPACGLYLYDVKY